MNVSLRSTVLDSNDEKVFESVPLPVSLQLLNNLSAMQPTLSGG